MNAPISEQPLRIVQVGLRYSPNLGDGAISECIAYGLKHLLPEAEVSFLDMSGRRQYGDEIVGNRSLAIAILDHVPQALGQMMVRYKLNRVLDGFEAQWRDQLDADFVVVGGGQIFSDKLLNFPIKVARAARLIAARGTPVAVFGAGVAGNWTRQGTGLFRELGQAGPRMIGLRDEGSLANWTRQYGGNPAPVLTVDPAHLAAGCFGAPESMTDEVGLCVTDFGVLRHHSDGRVAGAGSEPEKFYLDCAQALVRAGRKVAFFTNGEGADEALLARVNAAAQTSDWAQGSVRAEVRAAEPGVLARRLGGYACVVAHRLHACIIGYSYQRPLVGLGWDNKLASFFGMIGAEAHFTADLGVTGDGVAQLVAGAVAAGVDPVRHGEMQQECWGAFDRLARVAVSEGPQA